MRGPRRLALVVAVAAVATAAGLAAQGRASFPGRNGEIFFTGYDRTTGAPLHLYAVHPDGSGLRQLTSGPGDDQAISVAAGGSHVLISRDTHEQCGHTYWAQGVDLFTINADGTGLARSRTTAPSATRRRRGRPAASRSCFPALASSGRCAPTAPTSPS